MNVEHQSLVKLPNGLRIAQPGDQGRLFQFCLDAFAEGNGFGGKDDDAIRQVIELAVWRQNNLFGIIDGPDRIEAALGLQASKIWYGGDADWFWSELLIYVHPLHRRNLHHKKLFRFAEWWAEHSGAPVVINLLPSKRLQAKDKLFEQCGGKRIGATYIFGDPTFRYMKDSVDG